MPISVRFFHPYVALDTVIRTTSVTCMKTISPLKRMPSALSVNRKELASNVPGCYLALFSGYFKCGWLLCFSCFSECPNVKLKMIYSDYVKQRILFYHCSGKSLQQIVRSLAEEGHIATKASLARFLRYYDETRMIVHAPGSGQKSKMTAE